MKDNTNKIFTLNNGDHVIALKYKGTRRCCCDHCYFKDTHENSHYVGCVDKKRKLFQGIKFSKDIITSFGLPICGNAVFIKLEEGM